MSTSEKMLILQAGNATFLQLEGQNVFGLSLKMPIYKCRRIFNPLTFLPRHRQTKKVSQRVEIQGWTDSAYFYYTVSLFKSFIFFPSQPHRQCNSNSSSWDRPSQDRHATNLALEESNHLSSAASFSPSSGNGSSSAADKLSRDTGLEITDVSTFSQAETHSHRSVESQNGLG